LHYENFLLPYDEYEYFLNETVCSLLYQTSHIKTWPYLHIYIKCYNSQYAKDYLFAHIEGLDTLMKANECLYYCSIGFYSFGFSQKTVPLQLSQEAKLIEQRNISQM